MGNLVVIFVGGVNTDVKKDKGHHDRNVFNYKMAAAMKIEEIMKNKPDETFEILLETRTYNIRDEKEPSGFFAAFQWNRKREYIEEIFQQSNIEIKCVNNKAELKIAMSTVKEGYRRSGDSLITHFYYYGHGEIGALAPQYPFFPDFPVVWKINIEDMKEIFKKEYFKKQPYIELITCHSASSNKEKGIEKSFAQVMSAHLEGIVKAIDGRASFFPVGNIGLFNNPQPPTLGDTISKETDTWKKFKDKSQVTWKTYVNGELQR